MEVKNVFHRRKRLYYANDKRNGKSIIFFNVWDEKDYIMRMIKEMVRVLFSLMFGKKYVSVELEKKINMKYQGKI